MRAALLTLLLVTGCTNLLDLQERTVFDGGVTQASCEGYCKEANEVCPGLFYKAEQGCLGVCAAYPQGDAAQPTGNTLACRNKALQNAKTYFSEMGTYCPAAGPAGVAPPGAAPQMDNSCGTLCENYCALYKSVCTEIPDCQKKCLLLPDRPTVGSAQMDFESGADTVQCRLAHVTAAATAKQLMDPGMQTAHCNHSGLQSSQLCDVNDDKVAGIEIQCADFCKLTMGTCQGANQVYETQQQCEAVCSKLQAGKLSDLPFKTDSRRCRRANAYVALQTTDPMQLAASCSDASPIPAHCGAGRCETYCALARFGCGAQFTAQFADNVENCKKDCEGLSDKGQNAIYSVAAATAKGSPLSCRGLRVARALSALVMDMPIAPGTCEAAVGLPAAGGMPTECQ